MIMGQLVTASTLKGDNDMMSLMWNMFILMFLTWVFKELLPDVQTRAKTYLKTKKPAILSVPSQKEEKIQTVTFTHFWKNDAPSSIEEALLDYVCNLTNPPSHIRRSKNTYIVNEYGEFSIHKDITCKLINSKYTPENEIESIEFQLRSKKLTTKEIKNFVSQIHTDYENTKVNQLGNRKYYFEEILVDDDVMRHLNWTMTRFHTNKKLSNIFGKHTTEVKDRVNLFMNHPEWYEERGIPYTLGILLHGEPGCGKTSLIKALAQETGRHIFDLKLRKTTTQTQLRNLFYNDRITALVDGRYETLIIPQNQRLYVIEDIDCLTPVVLSREYQPPIEEAELPEVDELGRQKPKVSSNEKLNLAFMLNLLDGVLEVPSRMLVCTSNYPGMLDKAFVRPGRMDINIRFEKATKKMIEEMAQHFYSTKEPLYHLLKDIDLKFTPAEVNKYLQINYKNMDAFITDINTASPSLDFIPNQPIQQPNLEHINEQRLAEMYPMGNNQEMLEEFIS